MYRHLTVNCLYLLHSSSSHSIFFLYVFLPFSTRVFLSKFEVVFIYLPCIINVHHFTWCSLFPIAVYVYTFYFSYFAPASMVFHSIFHYIFCVCDVLIVFLCCVEEFLVFYYTHSGFVDILVITTPCPFAFYSYALFCLLYWAFYVLSWFAVFISFVYSIHSCSSSSFFD